MTKVNDDKIFYFNARFLSKNERSVENFYSDIRKMLSIFEILILMLQWDIPVRVALFGCN